MRETTLGDVAEYINGRAFKPIEWEDKGLPIIRIQNLNKSDAHYNYSSKVYDDKYLVQNGDLLFAWSASLGAHIWNGDKAWLNQHIFKVVPKKGVNKFYLYYYLLHIIDELYAKTHGTGMVHITLKPFKATKIFLPSIRHQERMVDLIESLFEKLDRAKELVQNALDSFENRKSAILNRAFSGELTAKWREENGVDFERNWEEKFFCEVANIKSNLVDPKDYKDFPHIAPDSIEKRTGKLINYNTIESDGVTSSKHLFYRGQILYSKIRPYLSKVIIAGFDGLCSADMYPIETKLETKYLWYYMLSDDFVMNASSAGSRSVLPKINQKELGKIRIVCPPIEEQKEIVRLIDSLLEKEQKAKELFDILEIIDLMKKSILARAFRGELSTNNQSEDSAIELLKDILKENTAG